MTNAFDVQRQRIAETLRTQQTALQAQQKSAEEQTRAQARQYVSGVEVQKQQILADLYKQEELARKRMALGAPYISQAENIRKLEEEAKRVTGLTQSELDKALGSIKSQVKTTKQALTGWKEQALSEVTQVEEEFKSTNVELSTGEFVPKEQFDAYDAEHQQMLKTLGVGKFNTFVARERADFESNNVQVSANEWIPKEQWNTLMPEDQAKIKQLGYNAWQTEWKDTHVEIKPGVWYKKGDWTSLTPSQQQQILTTGSYTTVPATGEEALQQLKDAGKVPELATLKSYDPSTGAVQYSTPPVEPATADWKKLFFQQPSNIQQSYIFRQAPYLGMRQWSQLTAKEQEQILKDFSKEYSYLGQILSLPKEAQVEVAKGMLRSIVPAAVLMGATALVVKVPMPLLVATVLTDTINAAWIGLGTYGLTNTIKTVLPDPSIPTWQKSLDIALNVAVITAGIYGLGAIGRTPTVPSAVKAAAREAGAAAEELQAATEAAAKHTGVLLPSNVANRLQLAQANVISADTKFTTSLSELRLTSKQIAMLEKLSGYKGLEPLIRNVGDASKALSEAWDTASATARMYGSNSNLYIRTLEDVTAAKTDLDASLRSLRNALQPRFEVGPSATFESQWQAILKDVKAALRDAQATYDKAKMQAYNPAGRLDELYAEVRSTRQSLENLQSMYEAGVDPTVTGYKISWGGAQLGAPEGPAPKGGFGEKGTMSEEFYRQQYDKMVSSWGTPQPYEVSPGVSSPRASTALKQEVLSDLVELETPTTSKLTLTPEVAEVLPRAGMVVPTLTEAGLGTLASTLVATVASATRALVSAGSPALEEWVSPLVTTTPEIIKATEEATKAITQISAVSTPEVIAITETALRAAIKAATMGLTIPEISLAAQNAIQNEIQSLTDSGTITQTQAETLTQSAVQVATQIATQTTTETATETLLETLPRTQPEEEVKKKAKKKTGVKTLSEGEHVMTYTPPKGSKHEPFAVIGRRVPFPGVLTTRVEIPVEIPVEVEVEVERPIYTPIIVETPIPIRIETAEPVLVTPEESEEIVEGEYAKLPAEEKQQEPSKPSKPQTLDVGIHIEPIDLNLSPFDFKPELITVDTEYRELLTLTPKKKKGTQTKDTQPEVKEFHLS